jgi:hypothetical protein
MKIFAIESEKGFYISLYPNNEKNYYSALISGLDNFLFDGIQPEKTFHGAWLFIKNKPSKVTHMEAQKTINHRFKLIDESLASEKFPLELPKDIETVDEDDYIIWKEPYTNLRSLYKEIWDEQPKQEVEDTFEFNIILKVNEENIVSSNFSYEVQKTQYKSDGTTFITNKDITHQELDKILFPSLLLNKTSCKFTSEQSYKIIREHVRNHIDPKVATISSDYDFCFTVQKRVPLAKPYTYQIDLNSFSQRKRKPKLVTREQKEKHIEIFEMTHSEAKYRGYTPIREFEASNEGELKEIIDQYLKDLMTYINEPMKECDVCLGCGHVFNKDIVVP